MAWLDWRESSGAEGVHDLGDAVCKVRGVGIRVADLGRENE